MSCTVNDVSLDNLDSYWTDSKQNLRWSSVFIIPGWLQTWWQIFGSGIKPFIRVVSQGNDIIGIAPLMVKDETALFIGGTDVCDYQDFIVMPGMESDFFTVLIDDLKSSGIRCLDLKHVRPDSTVLINLMSTAQSYNCEVTTTAEEISLEMELPLTWEKYLDTLNAKQRHEVRRKLRRLSEWGKVDYKLIDNSAAVPDYMDTYLRMFTESRQDKAAFLTEQKESFFRLLAETMADIGLLRLGVLELDEKPVAAIMCFDYNDCLYLYNSGYDPEYNYLSVGVLSKALCIKDSIQKGKKRFDFLKGDEAYKYHLGGKAIQLYRCQVNIL